MVPVVPKMPERDQLPPPVILRAKVHYGSPVFGYSLALTLIAVTGALRLALFNTDSTPAGPFLLFYPAIATASFLAGTGPGLMATVAGAAFSIFLFPMAPAPPSWIALAVLGPLLATGFAHLRFIRDQHNAAARELASFKFIGDHASDWILLLSDTGHIRYANLRACVDLGWTEHELTGRHVEALVPDSQRLALKELLASARSGGAKPVEMTFEHRDGTPALVELGCTGVRTGEDQVIYAAARDIAERKRIEQESKRIDKKLQQVRHWESLGVLAGGLAHDFNNLLTSILGYASLAKDALPPGHEALPMLDNIASAGERSAELVRTMLATSGYRPQYTEQLQLPQILDSILASRPLPPNIQVLTDVASPVFNGDRRSIDTLLYSLISNAAEAYGRQDGVVRVSIRSGPAPRTPKATFEEGDAGAGECLGIVVEDNGCGMGPEVLERAFDPFFSTKFTGRGLGLPAVRGIVRAYSGKLLLETAPGKGTHVEVWLPNATAD
jgi:two-component system cell cycle sensor histidine kinase/response regulator CckA